MAKLFAEADSDTDSDEEESDSEEWNPGVEILPSDNPLEFASAMRCLPYRRRRMLIFELLKVRSEKKNKKIEELRNEAYRHHMYLVLFSFCAARHIWVADVEKVN